MVNSSISGAPEAHSHQPFEVEVDSISTGLEPRMHNSQYLEEILRKLDVFVESVFAKEKPLRGKQQLYLAVEEAVLEGQSNALLQRLLTRLYEKISYLFENSILPHISEDISFLKHSAAAWLAFREALHHILQVFAYLERHVVAYTSEGSLVNASENLWLELQQKFTPSFEMCISEALLKALEKHRLGDSSYEHELQVNTRMLITLGLYSECFEPVLLSRSAAFYERESEVHSKTLPLPLYCEYVEKRLLEEDARISLIFSETSRNSLLDVLRESLIENKLQVLQNVQELQSLIAHKRTAALKRLYMLFAQIDKLALLNACFLQAVKDAGTQLLFFFLQQQQPHRHFLQHSQSDFHHNQQGQFVQPNKQLHLHTKQPQTKSQQKQLSQQVQLPQQEDESEMKVIGEEDEDKAEKKEARVLQVDKQAELQAGAVAAAESQEQARSQHQLQHNQHEEDERWEDAEEAGEGVVAPAVGVFSTASEDDFDGGGFFLRASAAGETGRGDSGGGGLDSACPSAVAERRRRFIPQLLLLKDTHDLAWKDGFNCNIQFSYSIKEAWEKFLNQDSDLMKQVTRLLAKYCDSLLRSGSGASSLEKEMQRVMVIFRYLDAKDYFEDFYRNDLCKRLLLRKSANEDSERAMVSKLKEECGQQYTSRLENMFKDVECSRQTMMAFRENEAAQKEVVEIGIEFDAAVCAAGMWSQTTTADKVEFPLSFQKLHKVFSEFYRKEHSGRSLCWNPQLGTCEVRVNFAANRPAGSSPSFSGSAVVDSSSNKNAVYIIKMSELQAIILLLFNDSDMFTEAALQSATGINKEELHRQLVALYINKATRVLLRHRTEATEEYHVNFDFRSSMRRLQIMQIQLATQRKDEMAKADAHVSEDRSHQLDACIVRIMKGRKELRHNVLVAEVLEQTQFKCEPAVVKKRIELLLLREYITRDSIDHNLYRYLA